MLFVQKGRYLLRTFISIAILVLIGSSVHAEEDFSLRFPAALNRFSPYADVAAVGGASAGSKWQTSANPASTGWQHIESNYRISLNPQYSLIHFREGATLHVITESITKEFDSLGTFQLSLAQVRSNESTSLQRLDFYYDMDFVQAQWGKKVTEDLAFGANFNYSSSDMKYKAGSIDIAHSTSDSYGFRVGSLYRVIDHLLAGIVLDYSWTPSKTTYFDFFGPGLGDLRINDTTRQYSIRTGPSYEYSKDSTINMDYQFATFRNDTGKLDVHRYSAGIDHRIVDALFVRGGFTIDNSGRTSWTGGVGIYPLKQVSIDIGYQYNMFPELRSEFGRSQLVTVSLSSTL